MKASLISVGPPSIRPSVFPIPPAKPSQSGRRRGAKPKGRPSTGKLSRRPDSTRAGFLSSQESLRRFVSVRSCVRVTILRALRMRFSRHRGIYQSDVGLFHDQTRAGELPPAGRSCPGPRTRREDHALLIVLMSSGRLFLDRVGRHQSPSPLHRHEQNNMHSPNRGGKADISTLPESGHFYFALTPSQNLIDFPQWTV